MAGSSKPVPRVEGHVEALRAAGLDTGAFFDALVGIRDDTLLKAEHSEALYRLIASESFIWYLEALRGSPVDRLKLMKEATRVFTERAAAVMKEAEKESAAEALAKADITKDAPDSSAPTEEPSQTEAQASPPPRPRAAPRPRPRPRAKPLDRSATTRVDRPPRKKR